MTKPASLKTFLWFQSDLEAAMNFYKETFKDVEIFEENRMGEGAEKLEGLAIDGKD